MAKEYAESFYQSKQWKDYLGNFIDTSFFTDPIKIDPEACVYKSLKPFNDKIKEGDLIVIPINGYGEKKIKINEI